MKLFTTSIMNILFINADPGFMKEFTDFATQFDNKVFFSKSTAESISILNDNPIDQVVLWINRFADAAILKYINDYYRNIRIYIYAEEGINDILSSISRGNFTLIKKAVKLRDLSEIL